MVKSIFKRIIVGVGVALALMFIKGNLLIDVHAEKIIMQPTYIITGNFTTQSGNTVYQSGWGGLNVYAFPTNQATDWNGSASVYFVYNSFGSGYCTGTQNNGSVSGTIFNGSRALPSNALIYIEDRSNSTNHQCQRTINGARVDFTCNDVNLSHQQNIFVSGANQGRYGIAVQLDLNCSMTNEGLANSINGTINNSTQNIINNNNQNTQDIINNNNQNTQAIIDSNNDTKDSVDDLNDTLKDDDIDEDSAEDTITDLQGDLPTSGAITQLITLPIQLYQKIFNELGHGGVCKPFNIGTLFNHSLQFPCINLESLLGSALYNTIDILLCGFFILSFRKKMVDIFNHMTSLKDRGNELE